MIASDQRAGGSVAYRSGVGVAVVAALLTVWTTIVRDDGSGAAFFMVIMAAAVGSFAAWFRPDGMARAMAGVAAMQLALGLLVATAPSTASAANGVVGALVFNGAFAAMWLVAAALFRSAARGR